MQSAENMILGEPGECKKPRVARGEEFDRAWWKEERERRLNKYIKVEINFKVDVMVKDIEAILEGRADDDERPPKVIIYSNFGTAFQRIQAFLDSRGIQHAYAL
jgi:hypothetical protein